MSDKRNQGSICAGEREAALLAGERETALLSGERALRVLLRTKDELKGAGRYGMWEIFGGGFLSGAGKSPQAAQAKASMKKTLDALKEFHSYLKQPWVSSQQWIELNEFICFCEYFVNQPVADWKMRSKIDDARIQVSISIERLQRLLLDLRN